MSCCKVILIIMIDIIFVVVVGDAATNCGSSSFVIYLDKMNANVYDVYLLQELMISPLQSYLKNGFTTVVKWVCSIHSFNIYI